MRTEEDKRLRNVPDLNMLNGWKSKLSFLVCNPGPWSARGVWRIDAGIASCCRYVFDRRVQCKIPKESSGFCFQRICSPLRKARLRVYANEVSARS